jgi:ABC-type uncharacterized transport system involved in gliding motility auxiliary subunit
MFNRAFLKQAGSWAGFLIVPLLIAGAIYLITYRKFDTPIIIDLIALAIAAILYATTNPLTIRGTLGKQLVGSSLSAIVVCVAALGILVLVNILMQRVTVRSDLTASQQFSVTSTTIDVLKQIKNPITVTVFLDSTSDGGASRQQVQDSLKEYTSRTDKLNVSYIDVNFDPVKTREFNIKTVPTVVFQQGNQRQDVTSTDEQSYTRAILAVQSTVQRRAFFTTGHDEPPIQASGNGDSFSQAVQALKDNNYQVDTLNLLNLSTGGTITNTNAGQPFKLDPKTDVVILAPRGPLSSVEQQNLTNFLNAGGKAMFMFDSPSAATTIPTERRNNLNDLLKNWNVQFSQGLVLEGDPQQRFSAINTPIVFLPQTTGSSDILRGLENKPTLMSQATKVEEGQNKVDGTTFTPLLQSSVNSYLKPDLQNLGQPFDPAKDVRGPITIAATYQAPVKDAQGTETRLALFGTYLFASDAQSDTLGLVLPGNYQLFVNTVNWLSEQNNQIVIAPRTSNQQPFSVTQSQGSFIFWSTFLGLPLLVLFLGLIIWWRRR